MVLVLQHVTAVVARVKDAVVHVRVSAKINVLMDVVQAVLADAHQRVLVIARAHHQIRLPMALVRLHVMHHVQ